MTLLAKISNCLQTRSLPSSKKSAAAQSGPLVSSASVLSKDGCMIGISNLPNQTHRACSKRGLQYNVLLVGEAGVGKSSLIHTLFGTRPEAAKESSDEQIPAPTSTEIQVHQLEFQEKSFPVRLSILKALGFGNTVQSDQSWVPILDYIDAQYSKYLEQENSVGVRPNRPYEDSRIHACLYFISAATRTRLKAIDILTMKKLSEKVNLIPIISQSEILSELELEQLKVRLLDDIECYQIQTYQLPEEEEFSLDLSSQNRDLEQEETDAKLAAVLNHLVMNNAEDEGKDAGSIFEKIRKKKRVLLAKKPSLPSSICLTADAKQTEALLPFHIKEAMPFAIFSATSEFEAGKNGKKAKGRSYPWGQVDVEDPKASDLTKLRCCLIRTHLYDLLDRTNDFYYEQYRVKTLEKKTAQSGDRLSMIIHSQTPEQIEAKYRQDLLKMKSAFEKEWAKEDEKLKLKESQYIQIAAAHDHELEELRQYAASLQKEIFMFQKSPSSSSVATQ